jgi:hypothetical protein
MRDTQRRAIIALAGFWLLVFSVIFVFTLFWKVKLLIAIAVDIGPVGWIIAIGVLLYLICFALAMQP